MDYHHNIKTYEHFNHEKKAINTVLRKVPQMVHPSDNDHLMLAQIIVSHPCATTGLALSKQTQFASQPGYKERVIEDGPARNMSSPLRESMP